MCGASNLFIRNGQELKKLSAISNISAISDTSDIADIAELKTKSDLNIIETITIDSTENNTDRTNGKNNRNGKDSMDGTGNMERGSAKIARDILNISNISGSFSVSDRAVNVKNGNSRVIEYLYQRKYYILAMSFIYVMGAVLGSFLVKNIDKKEVSSLCSTIDSYFTGISSINMTARILSNIILNLMFVFGIYICGITVFAPLVCSAFCLYKGLACGFIIGVYIIGGGSNFHLAMCGLNFLLYLFIMMFFILTCAESMSFSSFLFKNDESFKACMSFKNISVYSSRHLLFLVLVSLSTVVQTIVIPVVYSLVI